MKNDYIYILPSLWNSVIYNMWGWSLFSNWNFWFFNWINLCYRSFCLLYWLWWSLNGFLNRFHISFFSLWLFWWCFICSLMLFLLLNFRLLNLLSSLLIISSFFLKSLKLFFSLFLISKTFLDTLFNIFFLWLILFLSLLELLCSSLLLGTSLIHSFVSLFGSLSCLSNGIACLTSRLVFDNCLNVILFKVIRLVENWMFSDCLLCISERNELFFFFNFLSLLWDGLGLFLWFRSESINFFLEVINFILLILDW